MNIYLDKYRCKLKYEHCEQQKSALCFINLCHTLWSIKYLRKLQVLQFHNLKLKKLIIFIKLINYGSIIKKNISIVITLSLKQPVRLCIRKCLVFNKRASFLTYLLNYFKVHTCNDRQIFVYIYMKVSIWPEVMCII